MVIAICGGSGFVGKFVIDELQAYGHEVIVVDIKEPPGRKVPFRAADVLDLPALRQAFQGCHVIIHLAAIPRPQFAPPEVVYRVNALGTIQVLEAAVQAGAERVVLASSDSALGYVFREKEMHPLYFPIDEDHPLQPQDAYALSKQAAEEACRSYTRRQLLSTICLRTCLVWDLARGTEAWQLIRDAKQRYKGLWVYVHAKDAARAYRLACEASGIEHETLFIAAHDHLAFEPISELITEFYPDVPLRIPFEPRQSLISNTRAQEKLGFEPNYSWHQFL